MSGRIAAGARAAAGGDARKPTEVVALSGPLDLHLVCREGIRELARYRTRRALLRSETWRRLAGEVELCTYGLAYRPARGAPRLTERGFVRLATWNIERGMELSGIVAYLTGHEVLSGVDVLMLNEVDRGMARSGNRDVAAEIAEALGMHAVYGNSYLCLDAGDTRDRRGAGARAQNAESLHGNAILSRHPIARAENVTVTVSKDKYESSDRRLGHKKALWAEVHTPLGPLPVFSVHLDVICSVEMRTRQLADVLAKVRERGLRDRVVLGGDLNTCTYDVQNLPRLCWNLAKKLARGGFPHGMYHYMHPFELYERPIFEALRREGFFVEPYNAMDQETTRYEVGDFESESKVSDFLPGVFVDLLRRKLAPWGGVAPLKLDWFFARGVRALGDDELPGSLGPRVFHRPTWEGRRLSDHDPVLLDVVF